jgi:hypothetical protein
MIVWLEPALQDIMRINSNLNSGGVDGPVPPNRSVPAAPSTPATSSFAATDALDTAVKSAPDTRASAVSNAKMLIGDVQYPPLDVIRGFSRLLAINLNSEGE